MKKTLRSNRGFTLIELLVVISIISLVASLTFANITSARTKALDTRKKADLTTIRTAIQSYTLDKGRAPNNYDCTGGTCVVNNARTTIAIEDAPGAAATESGQAYNAAMQELVTNKYLPAVPRSPGGAGYAYYNYGSGTSAGAVIATSLDAEVASEKGATGSCRPFPGAGGSGSGGEIGGGGGGGGGFELDPLDPGELGGDICLYFDGDVLYEGPCPLGFDSDAPNICSASLSKDFCLCSTY
ncbi:MAG: hypothetical protein AB202_00975 [Parcubacteria bacterium C7867-007]|nr:MAG: hypothetical protein AB202_00975 [Parcubacteria bacterium C7867-007]